MTKKQIVKDLLNKKGAKAKEQYLHDMGVKYTHDSQQRLVVFCEDGCVTLYPEWWGGGFR